MKLCKYVVIIALLFLGIVPETILSTVPFYQLAGQFQAPPLPQVPAQAPNQSSLDIVVEMLKMSACVVMIVIPIVEGRKFSENLKFSESKGSFLSFAITKLYKQIKQSYLYALVQEEEEIATK